MTAKATAKPAVEACRFPSLVAQLCLAAVLASVLWAYWLVVVSLFKEWHSNPDYSVGQLVVPAALVLLYLDRKRLARCRITPCWWGLGVILLAQLVRLYGILYLYESVERYSLVLTILGSVMLVMGWEVFWKTRWVLLFLFLMVPLPGRVHNMVAGPLQDYATIGTVVLLELLGITVAREGHVIMLNDQVPIAVAEACSGLRMLTAFIVVAAFMAYLVNRPFWQRAVLVVSSFVVAIVCNLARLTATAILYLLVDSSTAEKFFHDFAGVTMMPLAVLILVGELWLLNLLVLPDEPDRTTQLAKPKQG